MKLDQRSKHRLASSPGTTDRADVNPEHGNRIDAGRRRSIGFGSLEYHQAGAIALLVVVLR